jgi:hypothetical protein
LKKKDVGATYGPVGILSKKPLLTSSLTERAAEAVGSNHRKNRATGKEGETDHRRHKHSPRKRNGGTPVDYSGQMALRREQCAM